MTASTAAVPGQCFVRGSFHLLTATACGMEGDCDDFDAVALTEDLAGDGVNHSLGIERYQERNVIEDDSRFEEQFDKYVSNDEFDLRPWGRFARASHLVKAVFNAWADLVEELADWRLTCIAACRFKVERVDIRRKRDLFNAWKGFMSMKQVFHEWRNLSTQSKSHDRLRNLRQYLHAWAEAAYLMRQDRCREVQARRFHEYHLTLRTWKMWKVYAEDQRDLGMMKMTSMPPSPPSITDSLSLSWLSEDTEQSGDDIWQEIMDVVQNNQVIEP